MDRGGQVFLVSSRIRELPLVARWLLELVPDLRLLTIHGRMEKELIEERMLAFVRGDADLLLSTTIIESGLDIPNANTIVLRDADRYGLAELHQLRGRVGRERRRAHCLILLPKGRPVAGEAAQRLRAIEEYSDLGAGFRIAMRDLEIRGAGNLLGPQQSGHIAAVGYDLYCRLLEEAVRSARGVAPERPPAAQLGIDVPGGVPDDYVGDAREKFRVYRRVVGATSPEDLSALVEEVSDRFGPPPADLRRLVLAQRARLAFGALGVLAVGPGPKDIPGLVLKGPPAALGRAARAGFVLRALDPGSAFVPLPGVGTSPVALLEAALRVLAGGVTPPSPGGAPA
jgi:transcription-repair coupling factor (superfamily II helicase)